MTMNGTMTGTTTLETMLAELAKRWPQGTRVDELSAKLADRPAQNTLILLGIAAVLFYQAERGVNPKVKTIYDALEYCSSSLSVGYTSIFPQTAVGKLVATLLMTYGPALSGAMLEGPRKQEGEAQFQQRTAEVLEAILAELRSRPPGQVL